MIKIANDKKTQRWQDKKERGKRKSSCPVEERAYKREEIEAKSASDVHEGSPGPAKRRK